jgi:hypothetical protein
MSTARSAWIPGLFKALDKGANPDTARKIDITRGADVDVKPFFMKRLPRG